MNLQFHMQTQANASGDFLSFHGRSNPQSPISTLGFRSSALRQPLLPLLSHKSDAKRPIPLLRVRVVAEHSVDANRSADSSPAKALRRILTSLGIQQCPACFDALSAKLVERAGFRCCFTSGFSISGARLGLPDAGLISYGEMLDQGRQITEAVSIPVIGDADNGYGNAMNVKRTVNGYIKAGFAGIMLEDQVSPKACGHTQGRKVVSREEAVMRIRAAIDARKECGSDIVILARTDSRQALSFEEALWRTKALADAGADVLFIDALTSKQEMKAFCETAPLVPKLVNYSSFEEYQATMLEGGGKIPILDLSELEDVGYKLVAYPLSLIGVSILAMQNALNAIRSGYIPSPGSMPSFEKIKEILGFNRYYEEEKRYATSTSQSPSQSVSSSGYGVQHSATDDSEKKEGVPRHPRVDGQRVYSSRIESRKLRIKTTGRDGVEKINARIPAGGNLEGLAKFIPALGIVNLKAMVDDASGGNGKGEECLLDFEDPSGDRIQVFLE